MTTPKKLLFIGGTGNISTDCAALLHRQGHQVAVLSLLVTMIIGLWLVWPVRDDWAGSGELGTRQSA